MMNESILETDLFELAGLALDAYPDPVPFENFGPYQISKEPIGRGGMGDVFLAYDHILERQVAIKFLRTFWCEPDLRARFDQEIKILAKLKHPYIARLYEVGVHPSGAPFFAMEFIEGKPLDQFCSEQNCSLEERLRLFRSVCEAVQYAHSRLVIHRDLKPSNILVRGDGTPILLDFGIAKQLESMVEPVLHTQTEARFTRAYAAPEQLRREQVGIYTDVYALGVVLYELLAGKPPYDLSTCTPGEAELIIASGPEPPKPSLSTSRVAATRAAWNDLDVLCLKALKKDVPRRYHSVAELSRDIDHFFGNEPLEARPDSLTYKTRKFIVRNAKVLLAVSTVAVLIAALVGFYTWRLARARNAAVEEAARTKTVEQFLENLFEGGDKDAGPASDLKVVALLDRGVKQLPGLNRDPSLQADLYQTLGTIYRQLGNFKEADQLLEAALSRRKSIPEDNLADTMLALATLRIDEAKLSEAQKLSRAALALDLQQKKSEADVERARSTLARVFEERGQYKQALDVLSGETRSAPEPSGGSVDRAETLDVLGDAYFYLGQYGPARRYYTQAANLSRSIFGPQHPRVAEDYIDLGHVETQLADYPKAEAYYRQGLAIERAWYGNDHPLTARAESYLAQALGWQGKFNEDRNLCKHALTVEEKKYGPNHPRIALILSDLGFADFELNRLKDAEADYLRMLAIYRSNYGEKHQFTAIALGDLGHLYWWEKQYQRAEALFRESLGIDIQVLPAGALNTAIAQLRLGRVLLNEKRYQEAEPYSLAGYEAIKKQVSPSSEYIRSGASDLFKIYSALNLPEEANKLRAELHAASAKK